MTSGELLVALVAAHAHASSRTTAAATAWATRSSARPTKASRPRRCYFVPLGETLEIWQVRGDQPARQDRPALALLRIEFCLWDAQDDATNFQRNFSTARSKSRTASSTTRPNTASGAITSRTSPAPSRWPVSTRSATNSSALIAVGTTRSRWSRASRPTRSRTAGSRMGSHHVRVNLEAGRDARRYLRAGLSPRTRATRNSIRLVRRPSTSAASSRSSRNIWTPQNVPARPSKRCGDYWDDAARPAARSTTPATSTPTAWSTSGTRTSAWSRSTCRARRRFYESGIGRGMGFRDSNQDLLGFVHMVPARARERILDIAATQLRDRRRLSPVSAVDQARQQRRRAAASTTIRRG